MRGEKELCTIAASLSGEPHVSFYESPFYASPFYRPLWSFQSRINASLRAIAFSLEKLFEFFTRRTCGGRVTG
jgi:hypothetical protein